MKSKLFGIAFKKSILFVILGALFALAGIGMLASEGFSFGSVIVAGLGILLLVLFGLPLLNGGYLKSFNETLSKSGLTMEQVEADLMDAEHGKNYDLGRKYMLVYSEEPKLVVLRDLVWCYGVNTTTTHKLYGVIPTGKTKSYSVKLVNRDRSEVEIPVSKEGDEAPILEAVKQRVPGVVAGYNEKIANLMKTDFAGAVRYVDEKNSGN